MLDHRRDTPCGRMTRLRRHRLGRGLSQVVLARELGVHQTSITKWENGQAIPYPRHGFALEQLFGLPLEDLLAPEMNTAPAQEGALGLHSANSSQSRRTVENGATAPQILRGGEAG